MNMSKIIALYGANGSGKTTLAVNVASRLTELGSIVGIVQTNLAFPSVQSFLGIQITDSDTSMQDICFEENNKRRNEEQQFVQNPKNKKMFVLSVTNHTDCLSFADKNAMDDVDNVSSFWQKLKNSDFDYIIADCDNNVNNLMSSSALFYADMVIHTIKPTIQGLNFYLAYEAFIKKSMNKKSDSRLILVANADENMLDLKQLEKSIEQPIDVVIPFDKEVRVAENRGIPAVEKYEKSFFSKDFPKYLDSLMDIVLSNTKPKKKEGVING